MSEPYSFTPTPPLRPGRVLPAAVEAKPQPDLVHPEYSGAQLAYGIRRTEQETYEVCFRHFAYDGPDAVWTRSAVVSPQPTFAAAAWWLARYQEAFHPGRAWVWLIPRPVV